MTKPGSQRNPTIESLKDRIARDPFTRAFLQLAEEYRKEGRFQEAIQVCLDGLQRHPTYHTARISLGRTYMEAGDMENARRAFTEVLELQPENHLAAKLLAEIQKKMGDTDGAAATYRDILRYYPNDREVEALLLEAQHQAPAVSQAGKPAATPPLAGGGTAPVAPIRPAPTPAAPGPPATATPVPASPAPPTSNPAARTWPGSEPSFDFRPEDLGVSPSTAGESWSGHAGGARAPWPDLRRDDEGSAMDDALQTNTLAELYLRQGLVDRATEVYRGMLRVDPENQKAARRLAELAQVGPQPVGARATGSAPAPRSDAARAPLPPAPRSPSVVVPVVTAEPDGARRGTIRRLERWLASVSPSPSKGGPPR
jgi:tetratricopeptide (TPR) repeat protein